MGNLRFTQVQGNNSIYFNDGNRFAYFVIQKDERIVEYRYTVCKPRARTIHPYTYRALIIDHCNKTVLSGHTFLGQEISIIDPCELFPTLENNYFPDPENKIPKYTFGYFNSFNDQMTGLLVHVQCGEKYIGAIQYIPRLEAQLQSYLCH